MKALSLALGCLLLAGPATFDAHGQGQEFGGRMKRRDSWTREPSNRALSWLARHQDESGCWVSDGFPDSCKNTTSRCRDNGAPHRDVRATSVSLLAFMAAGSVSGEGEYGADVKRGLAWLRRHQEPSGRVRSEDAETLLGHAAATLALIEGSYFAREDHALRAAAQSAFAFSVAEELHLHSDPAILGWALLSLVGATELQLSVPDEAREAAADRLRSATRVSGPQASLVTFSEDHTEDAHALTAIALLALVILERDSEDRPDLERYGEYLIAGEASARNWVSLHYATLGLYQLGDRNWATWIRQMKPVLLDSQRNQRHMDGSWDPTDETGGRVFFTAMNAMNLAVYTRYKRMLPPR